MPARLVLPTLGGGLGGVPAEESGAPQDLEALLRRAATDAVAASANAQAADGASLGEDALEAIACIACETLGDNGNDLEEQRSRLLPELSPVFDESMVSEALRSQIVDALLAAARGADGKSTEASPMDLSKLRPSCAAILPPPPVRAPTEEVSAPRYRRRGEVERARAEEYLQEHEKLLELEKVTEEAREQELKDFYGVSPEVELEANRARGAFNPAAAAGVAPASPSSSDSEEDVEDAATTREREATKQRLRALNEPATYFGENDEARTARLNQLELSREQDEMGAGSVNVLQMVNRRAQHGVNADHDEEDFHIARAKKPLLPLPALVDCGAEVPPPLPMDDDDDDGLDAADEAAKAVSLWLRKTLREWETELTERQAAEKNLRDFADERGQYRQSKQYLRPLRKALRDGSVDTGIVASLSIIAEACEKKNYREAKECYMRLAIGNSAWPIGVTTVTFHDRPNRHLIGEDNVAHILNDETTRKYVQMVKRLVTYAEKRWPVSSHIA